MKKYLLFIFAFSLCLGFAACGSDDEKDEPEKPEEKPFVWNGDWNDPEDPNYKPEGYNPIEGVWRSDEDPDRGLLFDKDFNAYILTFFDGRGYTKELWNDYVINNTAFMLGVNSGLRRYVIYENEEKLRTTPNRNDDDDWRYYTKVEE